MFSKIENAFQLSESALNLIELRQEIISSNIANADTPNYQAKDINFIQEMKKIINLINKKPKKNFFSTHSKSSENLNRNYSPIIIKKKNTTNKPNNNTVNINYERMKFIENAIQYQTLLTVINSEIKDLTTVIQG